MSDNPGDMATPGRDGAYGVEGYRTDEYESVAKMTQMLEHAQAVCADRGWDPDDTPWVVCYLPIGRGPRPPEGAFEWARQVVRDYEASKAKAAGTQTKPLEGAESLDQNESPGGSP